MFDDPTRMPYYDEKAKVWNLSSKFDLDDNDEGFDNDDVVMRHPFFEKKIL